jgi:thiol-disulfide isomerase/thioredoxin
MKKYAVFTCVAVLTILPLKASYWKTMAIYAACDSACFFVKAESRNKNMVSVSKTTMYYAIKRKEKPNKWFSYDISYFNPGFHYTKFKNAEKIYEMYEADSLMNSFIKYKKPYEKESVPINFAHLPIHQGSGSYFSIIPKKMSENENSEIYIYRSSYYNIKIGIDKATNLVKTYEYESLVDDSFSFKYEYQYIYFKAGKKYLYSVINNDIYIPVTLDNKNILSNIYNTFNPRKDSLPINNFGKVSELLKDFLETDKNYLLIDFWHIKCYPCLKLLPVFDSLNKLNNQVSIRLINVANSDADVVHFKKRNFYTFPHYCDTSHIIENYFKPPAYPTVILLNKQLQIVAIKTGNDKSALMEIYRKTLE